MPKSECSEALRKWRGKRLQKEAANLLGISVRTYQNWEEGVNVPAQWCLKCLMRKIGASDEAH